MRAFVLYLTNEHAYTYLVILSCRGKKSTHFLVILMPFYSFSAKNTHFIMLEQFLYYYLRAYFA